MTAAAPATAPTTSGLVAVRPACRASARRLGDGGKGRRSLTAASSGFACARSYVRPRSYGARAMTTATAMHEAPLPGSLRIAEVAVTLPVPGRYHYVVPSALADRARVGARVLVRFGSKKVTGVVVPSASRP